MSTKYFFLILSLFFVTCQNNKENPSNASSVTHSELDESNTQKTVSVLDAEELQYQKEVNENVLKMLPPMIPQLLIKGEHPCVNLEIEGPLKVEADLTGNGLKEMAMLVHNNKQQIRLMIFHPDQNGKYTIINHSGLVDNSNDFYNLDLAHLQVNKDGKVLWFLNWKDREMTLGITHDPKTNSYILSDVFAMQRGSNYYSTTEIDYIKQIRIQGGEQMVDGKFQEVQEIISKVNSKPLDITDLNQKNIFNLL